MSSHYYIYDRKFSNDGYKYIAGIDEAGRGPLAGPVVAGCVILDLDREINALADSKQVKEKKRDILFWDILCSCVDVGVGIVDACDIDRVNIKNATFRAMAMAVGDMNIEPEVLLIDAFRIPDVDILQMPIIKGDTLSASIAAASIIAKVTRDRIMAHYDTIYPNYDFKRHKGYPTKMHIEKLLIHGPCPIHRLSYSPVRNIG
ncbi:ribonuclease HII, partial [Candidatus Magnetoovum chiemensis]